MEFEWAQWEGRGMGGKEFEEYKKFKKFKKFKNRSQEPESRSQEG
jgi:hypothetical protein